MTANIPSDEEKIRAEMVRRQLIRDSLGEWWERLAAMSANWDIETVKHLVVLNAAGVAGVATLLAGNKPLHPDWIGAATLLGYGFGVVFAILNMHLAARAFDGMSGEISERVQQTWDLEQSADGMFAEPKAGSRFSVAGQICGWISAASAIASTLAVGISLVRF